MKILIFIRETQISGVSELKFISRTMPLKAGARVNTPPLESNRIKSYADTPSACCGELHCNPAHKNLKRNFLTEKSHGHESVQYVPICKPVSLLMLA